MATIHFLALISPGPNLAITFRQSIMYGRQYGMMTALGIGAAICLHVMYTLLGIGALMHSTPWILQTAETIGAIYLLYLGLNIIRTAGHGMNPALNRRSSASLPPASARRSFLIGFTTNATNPKVTLFFLAIFTTIVSASTAMSVQIFYGFWICVMDTLWFSLVSIIFTTGTIRDWFLRNAKWFERLMGGLLIVFAARLVWDVVAGLLSE